MIIPQQMKESMQDKLGETIFKGSVGDFGLALRGFNRYEDISKFIGRDLEREFRAFIPSREGEHVRRPLPMPVFAVEGGYLRITHQDDAEIFPAQ
jgi:hypothetical protein